MLLTREQILKTKDYERKTIDLKEWGGDVIIRSLSHRERAEIFDRPTSTAVERTKTEALVVASAVIDETGDPIFQPEDLEALQKKNPKVIERIAKEILVLSGIFAPEEVEKNFSPVQTASSSSA